VRSFASYLLRTAATAAASAALLLPSVANAATTSLGQMVGSFANDVWQPFCLLVLGLAFLSGLWLIATGISKMRESGGHQHQNAALEGVMRIIGGAFLVGLPDTVNLGIASFYGAMTGHAMNSANGTAGAVTDCLQGGGVTCVAQNIATNLVPVFVEVSFGLLYFFGVVIVFHALYSMATSHGSGQQQSKGWLPRIIIGLLICNVPHLFSLFETTFGVGDGTITDTGFNQSSSLLAYTANGTSQVLTSYASLIQWCFHILVMFGVIAFIRGILQLRAFAEGKERGHGGMGGGITHVVGGIMLANSKWTVCIVLNTFFGQGMGFC